MMTTYKCGGRTVTEAEALDTDGCLRDGYTMNVGLMFRDGASRDGTATRRITKEIRDPMGRLLSTSEAIEEELDDEDESVLDAATVAFHDGHGRVLLPRGNDVIAQSHLR